MNPELIGLIGVLTLLALLAAGTRIAVALGVVGVAGLVIVISPEAALIKSGLIAFDTVSRYELGVLPLFLLMAHLCFAAGASRDFYDSAAKFVGHRPGGLALASIGGCAGFGVPDLARASRFARDFPACAEALPVIITPPVTTAAAFAAFFKRPLRDCFSIAYAPS